jgi:hypothetical protein
MTKQEPLEVARPESDTEVRPPERSWCVELSEFELELIAGGAVGGGNGYQKSLTSTKR